MYFFCYLKGQSILIVYILFAGEKNKSGDLMVITAKNSRMKELCTLPQYQEDVMSVGSDTSDFESSEEEDEVTEVPAVQEKTSTGSPRKMVGMKQPKQLAPAVCKNPNCKRKYEAMRKEIDELKDEVKNLQARQQMDYKPGLSI